MSIDVLKEDIKENRIRSIYLFYGPEHYLKNYYIESIVKSLLREDLRAFNLIVMEGKSDTETIINNCETMPVFSERKIVVVRNSGLFKAKSNKSDEKEEKKKSKNTDLISYIAGISKYTCLIFAEEEIDKRLKIVDTIKKNGLVVEFPFQKPSDLSKWVIKVLKSYKKDIDLAAAAYLVEISEPGMTDILNEINKLVLFIGNKDRATIDDINEVCTKTIKSRIFDLTDAIAEKNEIKALKLLNDIIILKEPVPKIFFMITRQIRQILEIKLLKNNGLSIEECASRIGITAYAVNKITKQANAFTVEELKKAIEECLDMDIAVKSGKLNERIAAEILITRLTNKK